MKEEAAIVLALLSVLFLGAVFLYRRFRRTGFFVLWLLTNIVGFGVGFRLGRVAAFAMFGNGNWGRGAEGPAMFGAMAGTLLATVFGAVVAAMQWLLLRRHVSWAGWWASAVIVIIALCGAVVYGYMGKPWLDQGKCVTCGVVPVAMFGAVFGMLTGIPLLWMLRDSKRLEPPSR
ncbi:MAG: hypothetical protein HY288_00215 [Planctomycetia bacterium]|nr:hypothetical protein [Planctomycetia bacterium]